MEKIEKMLEIIVKTIDDRKGRDIVVFDTSAVNPLAKYSVICDADNKRLCQAIAHEIDNELYDNGFEIHHIEGRQGGEWVLVDAKDVLIHIFQAGERIKYNLEKHWADQPQIDISKYIEE